MALDLVILDDSKEPIQLISIGSEEHYHMMEISTERELKCLSRLKNYYAHARFQNSELAVLKAECLKLISYSGEDAALVRFMHSFLQLIEHASRGGRDIEAVAD